MYTRIIVAVDGSENGLKAVQHARELGARFNSEIILLHAYPHTSDMRAYEVYDRLLGERKAEGQKILDQARDQFGELPLEITDNLLESPAAEAILTAAKARKAELIIMGTRGRGTLKGLMLGSVSSKVVHHAPCPVLVIR